MNYFYFRQHYKKLNLLSVILVLSLTACWQSEDKIILIPSAVIVAFGDSLTVGVGASKGLDYPSVLAKKLGVKVINAGVSGEDTHRALGRVDGVLKNYDPQVVILLHGGNDILRRYNLSQTKGNLSKIITKIQKTGAKVILVGVPKLGILLKTASFYANLAKQHKVIYIEDKLSDLLADNDYKSDTIHLNSKGYEKLAEKLASYFKVVR